MSVKIESYEAIPSSDLDFVVNKGPFFGKRHWLVLTLTLLYETTHSVKVYMSICIVAMTDPTANSNKNIPTYEWKDKGFILSAYLWGLLVSQLLAGWIVSRFKAKWPIVFTLLLCSFVGFLIPTVASSIGSIGVATIRGIQGATMGSMTPFIYYLLGKWIPPSERSRLMGIVVSGTIIGTAIAMYLSGVMAASTYGWPLVIYFYSGLCLIWCFIFAFVVSNSPAEHPTITMEEKLYIEHSLCQTEKKKLTTPYLKIMKSVPVWANCITRLGGYFGYFTILSEISLYLKNILHADIQSNGLLSAIPYVCTIFFMYLFGYLSDLLQSRKICSITTTRKIMAFTCIKNMLSAVFSFGDIFINSAIQKDSSCMFVKLDSNYFCSQLIVTASVVAGVFLLFLAQCGPGQTATIIFFLAMMVSLDTAGASLSILVNIIDLSPNHAGTLEGMINQVAMITASAGPLLVQFIVSDKKKTEDEWKLVFYIVAGVKIATGLVFLIFGSSETQSWNDEIDKTEKDLQASDRKDGYNLTSAKS